MRRPDAADWWPCSLPEQPCLSLAAARVMPQPDRRSRDGAGFPVRTRDSVAVAHAHRGTSNLQERSAERSAQARRGCAWRRSFLPHRVHGHGRRPVQAGRLPLRLLLRQEFDPDRVGCRQEPEQPPAASRGGAGRNRHCEDQSGEREQVVKCLPPDHGERHRRSTARPDELRAPAVDRPGVRQPHVQGADGQCRGAGPASTKRRLRAQRPP